MPGLWQVRYIRTFNVMSLKDLQTTLLLHMHYSLHSQHTHWFRPNLPWDFFPYAPDYQKRSKGGGASGPPLTFDIPGFWFWTVWLINGKCWTELIDFSFTGGGWTKYLHGPLPGAIFFFIFRPLPWKISRYAPADYTPSLTNRVINQANSAKYANLCNFYVSREYNFLRDIFTRKSFINRLEKREFIPIFIIIISKQSYFLILNEKIQLYNVMWQKRFLIKKDFSKKKGKKIRNWYFDRWSLAAKSWT